MAIYLAGDIGGTKSLLGLFTPEGGPRAPARAASLTTSSYASAEALVGDFLDGQHVDGGMLAVAGPVVGDRIPGSTLPWDIEHKPLVAAVDGPLELMNDLEATATFVPYLNDGEIEMLHDVPASSNGVIGVVAPGTGIGEAILVRTAAGAIAVASEAGHTDFAPNGEVQTEYLLFLRQRFGHVSLERACSGGSMPLLYEFLSVSGRGLANQDVAAALATVDDATPVILQSGLSEACEVCALALDTFVAMLAAAAGNLALQVVATGGIYLGGGIPPRILPALRRPMFLDALAGKGRFEPLVRKVPVGVILEPRAALFGAAQRALSAASAPDHKYGNVCGARDRGEL